MNRTEILEYLLLKIPSYEESKNSNSHILQFDLYVNPFYSKGKNTFFIKYLCEVLEFIDLYVNNYSKITIDDIASYPKNEPQQFFQKIAEVYILYNLLNLDGVDKNSVILEPNKDNKGKNPEYRIFIKGCWYAFEVKTPDYRTLTNRQKGIQITTRLSEDEIKIIKKYKNISYTKDNKIKDFIENANNKFEEYSKVKDYKNDIKILVIVWDDFINEVVSAIANPTAGLVTSHSFSPNTKFNNLDGILVSRFLTPLKRLFYFGEVPTTKDKQLLNIFNSEHNSIGISFELTKLFNWSIFHQQFHLFTGEEIVAENYPTDLINWDSSVGITGLNKIEKKHIRETLIRELAKINTKNPIYSYNYTNFGNINLNNLWDKSKSDSFNINYFKDHLDLISNIDFSRAESKEIDFKKYQNVSEFFKNTIETEYEENKNTKALCRCNSKKLFKDCCEKNLKHYKYETFYER